MEVRHIIQKMDQISGYNEKYGKDKHEHRERWLKWSSE